LESPPPNFKVICFLIGLSIFNDFLLFSFNFVYIVPFRYLNVYINSYFEVFNCHILHLEALRGSFY
jgi:hypothetical protein